MRPMKKCVLGVCAVLFGLVMLLSTYGNVDAATLKGMDVSVWQGNINWKTVKNEGYQFAMIRVGHGSRTLDTKYKTNMSGASSNGISAGVYFYSTATTTAQSKKDAQWVIESMRGYKVSYPVAIDMEDSSLLSLTDTQRSNIALAFCNEIKAAGYYPMIYCNTNWYDNYLNTSMLSGIDIWLARYGTQPATSKYRYTIWQYSSKGVSAGITVNTVDLNRGYVDYTTKITPRTAPLSSYSASTAKWIKSGNKWRYQLGSGAYVTSAWRQISGKWYYFDGNGYMVSGWKKVGGIWYYFGGASDGAMKTGWKLISSKWYYFNSSGAMKIGWIKYGGQWYYLRSGGDMAVSRWVAYSGKWYYLNSGGDMRCSKWLKYNNCWYYLNSSGTMRTSSWLKLSGKWYYLSGDGIMLTGWKKYGGYWYYLGRDGAMLTSTTVNENGKKYNLGRDGRWIP